MKVSHMHQHIQLLGQGILMCRHNIKWDRDYFDNKFQNNMLYETDKLLFNYIAEMSDVSVNIWCIWLEYAFYAWNFAIFRRCLYNSRGLIVFPFSFCISLAEEFEIILRFSRYMSRAIMQNIIIFSRFGIGPSSFH